MGFRVQGLKLSSVLSVDLATKSPDPPSRSTVDLGEPSTPEWAAA